MNTIHLRQNSKGETKTAQAEFESGIIVLDRYIEVFPPELNSTTRQEDEMKWRSVIDA